MTVHQLETEMPAAELLEWFAHYSLSADEQRKERDRQKRRKGKL
jgi:hypothetical protein